MKTDTVYLHHIKESIAAIEEFTQSMKKTEFLEKRIVQSATIREIEIIGKAVKQISSKVQKKYPDIPWSQIARTRDKMIHHYFGIDLHVIWNIITIDIPFLKKEIAAIEKQNHQMLKEPATKYNNSSLHILTNCRVV
ncbi:MAG: DUF86 domain-containing protein [Candidatus Woesearchaeota archaeon]